jgi:hypothetical protein
LAAFGRPGPKAPAPRKIYGKYKEPDIIGRMENFLFQFIPIVFIFLFLRYTRDSVIISHTVLGKLFAVALILFYTKIDAVYGLVTCLLVILYYQTDYVEGMKSDSPDDTPKDSPKDPPENPPKDSPKDSPKVPHDDTTKPPQEGFAEYNQLYDTPPSQFDQSIVPNKPFIQHHCDNHQTLKYKNQPVRPDMAEHVFTEIKFDDTPCNICSKGCDFRVKYLNREEDLMRPRQT